MLIMYIIGREEMKLIIFGWNTIEMLNWNTDQVNLLKYLCCKLFSSIMDEMIFVVPTDTAVRTGLGTLDMDVWRRRLWGKLRKKWWGDFQRQLDPRDLGTWGSLVGVETQQSKRADLCVPLAHATEFNIPPASVWSSLLDNAVELSKQEGLLTVTQNCTHWGEKKAYFLDSSYRKC